MFDDNTVGEVSSDEVDDCSLTEVLKRLDAFAVAHEQLKARRRAAHELAQKVAAEARRAEYHRKINEKANRQREWEETERASVVYRPRPRTVPIVRCSTPAPPPESPKEAHAKGNETQQKPSARTSPRYSHEGDMMTDGVDNEALKTGNTLSPKQQAHPKRQAREAVLIDTRPKIRPKGDGELSEDDKKSLNTATAESTSLENPPPATPKPAQTNPERTARVAGRRVAILKASIEREIWSGRDGKKLTD